MPGFIQPILFDFLLVFGTLLALKRFPRLFRDLKLAWRRLAHNRVLSLALAGALPVIVHLAFYPHPEPAVSDEFAYLLQADTFAHGRLANPPRPYWPHFEQVQVISQPVFASKYQPLPAAFLALGQRLGDPYYGILLTAAVAFCAALWMLYGWFPPSYALLGWLIAVVKLGPATYWMNSYWGGLVPALGGFLVTGAWPRLRQRVTLRDSVFLGLGMVLLAASRPFDGFVISTIVCSSLLWLNWRRWEWMYGAVAVTAAGFALLGFYNFRVTGNALQMPYQLFNQQYMAVRNFMVHPMIAAPPVYRHREFQMLFVNIAASALSPYQEHPWWAQAQRLGFLWNFYCGNWALSLPLLALPFACTNRRIRWAAAFLALFIAPMALVIPVLPHYYAAAAGLWTILLVGGLHRLRFWNPQGRPTGSLLSRVAVAALVVIFVRDVIRKPPEYTSGPSTFKSLRRDLIAQLNAQPGKHLVLVHYAADHNPDMEFVVNGADLDESRILWARSMNPQSDHELIEHFRDRRSWLLAGDDDSPTLQSIGGNISAHR